MLNKKAPGTAYAEAQRNFNLLYEIETVKLRNVITRIN